MKSARGSPSQHDSIILVRNTSFYFKKKKLFPISLIEFKPS